MNILDRVTKNVFSLMFGYNKLIDIEFYIKQTAIVYEIMISFFTILREIV
jgi:hypothetical protein